MVERWLDAMPVINVGAEVDDVVLVEAYVVEVRVGDGRCKADFAEGEMRMGLKCL